MRTAVLVALLALLTLAACTAAAAERMPALSLDANAVLVVARDSRFPTEPVAAPAGMPFSLAFDNLDRVPHNVVLVDASGQTVFSGTIFSGPRLFGETVPELAPGSYRIVCAIHPDMSGTLIAA